MPKNRRQEVPKKKPTRCEFCLRETRAGTTEHHLIPSTLHSNEWFKKRYTRQQMQETVDLCSDCHGAISFSSPASAVGAL